MKNNNLKYKNHKIFFILINNRFVLLIFISYVNKVKIYNKIFYFSCFIKFFIINIYKQLQ